jgi:hypothetical protein
LHHVSSEPTPIKSPRSCRLFKLLSDHQVLLKFVESCSWEPEMVSKTFNQHLQLGSPIGAQTEPPGTLNVALARPTRAVRRLVRFISYTGNRQVMFMLKGLL